MLNLWLTTLHLRSIVVSFLRRRTRSFLLAVSPLPSIVVTTIVVASASLRIWRVVTIIVFVASGRGSRATSTASPRWRSPWVVSTTVVTVISGLEGRRGTAITGISVSVTRRRSPRRVARVPTWSTAVLIVITSAASSGGSTIIVTVGVGTLSRCHVLDCEDSLVQLSSVCGFFGLGCFFDGFKLHKSVVSFHIDAHNAAVLFKEHFKILDARRFNKVDNEESFGRFHGLSALFFFALDAAVAFGEIRAKRIGNTGNGTKEENKSGCV